MSYVLVLLTAMSVSVVVIPLMVRLAPRLGMVDRPSARKVHAVPMARVGGWGIALGALVAVVLWLPFDRLLWSFLFGSAVLIVSGTLDDTREMGHWSKFIGQFLAVVPVVYWGGLEVERLPFMGLDALPDWFCGPFTVFALVGMINAINHSDGLDGLAGGEALLSLVAMGLLAHDAGGTDTVLLTLAVIGAVLGFLRFNTHPARVFMGDVGSQFLGFAVGFVAVVLTQRVNPALSPAAVALLLGLPIMDILAVLVQRVWQGMNWFHASRNHVHHRLLDLGFLHSESVVVIYGIQAFFVSMGMVLAYDYDAVILGLYLGTCTLLFVLLTAAERGGWRVHGAAGSPQPGARQSWLAFLEKPWISRLPRLAVALCMPVYVVVTSLYLGEVPYDFGVASALLFAVVLLQLLFGRRGGPWVMRVALYGTIVYIVYLSYAYPPFGSPLLGRLDLLVLGLLAVAVALSVRKATAHGFTTTPMDWLTLFVLGGAALFSDGLLGGSQVVVAVLKAIVLLYGCEVLISAREEYRRGAVFLSLGALAVLSLRGLV